MLTRAERDALRKRRLPLLTVRLLDALDAKDEEILRISNRLADCSEVLGRRAERGWVRHSDEET